MGAPVYGAGGMNYLKHKDDAECAGNWLMTWPPAWVECDRCGACYSHNDFTQAQAARENTMGVLMHRLAKGTI